ncbi:NUDIX domain-containing protein [Candidatus Collierbacteria bacterium]|nr:NUDIX domain-containing protein [Candidatus Collierbacteria bacterium]
MNMISEHSAGGVVFRRREKGRTIEWFICKHSGYHKWVLPKGIIETGEMPEDAALREVGEEAGIKAKIVKKIIPDVAYKYTKNGILVDKKVEFFLMEYASGDIKDHCWEMEEVKWAPANEALELLEFPTEKKVFEQATKILKS